LLGRFTDITYEALRATREVIMVTKNAEQKVFADIQASINKDFALTNGIWIKQIIEHRLSLLDTEALAELGFPCDVFLVGSSFADDLQEMRHEYEWEGLPTAEFFEELMSDKVLIIGDYAIASVTREGELYVVTQLRVNDDHSTHRQ
jgi:hypothetical protein